MVNGTPDSNSCKGAAVGTTVPFEGAKFKWLSANVISTSTGQALLPAYGVKTFNGVKVAFVGMTLKATPTIVAASGVAGLEFRDEAVDIVISGHTHSAYNYRLPNAAGRAIPVTSASAYGRVVTDINVTVDPVARNITAASATNRLVSRSDASVKPDAAVAKIVASYKGLVDPIANAVIGSIAAALPSTRTDTACNMPVGNLWPVTMASP